MNKSGERELPWHNRCGSAQLAGDARLRVVTCGVAACTSPQSCTNRWCHWCTRTTQQNSFLILQESSQITVSHCWVPGWTWLLMDDPSSSARSSVFTIFVSTHRENEKAESMKINYHKIFMDFFLHDGYHLLYHCWRHKTISRNQIEMAWNHCWIHIK